MTENERTLLFVGTAGIAAFVVWALIAGHGSGVSANPAGGYTIAEGGLTASGTGAPTGVINVPALNTTNAIPAFTPGALNFQIINETVPNLPGAFAPPVLQQPSPGSADAATGNCGCNGSTPTTYGSVGSLVNSINPQQLNDLISVVYNNLRAGPIAAEAMTAKAAETVVQGPDPSQQQTDNITAQALAAFGRSVSATGSV